MATAIEKIKEIIKSKGIDIEQLPGKTKRKLSEFEKLYNNKAPVYFNKEGKRKDTIVQKLNDLAEDILEDIEIFEIERNNQFRNNSKDNKGKSFFDLLFS